MSYSFQKQEYDRCIRATRILNELRSNTTYISKQSQYINSVLNQIRPHIHGSIHTDRSYIDLCNQLKNMNLINDNIITIHQLGYRIPLHKITINAHGSFVLDRSKVMISKIQKEWNKANKHPLKQKFNIGMMILLMICMVTTTIMKLPTWIPISCIIITGFVLIRSIFNSFSESHNNKSAHKKESELRSILGL